MKLTNGEIFNAREPLEKLLREKLPVKTSYGLAKLASKLDAQTQVIEKVRRGLFQTYGEKDPDKPSQLKIDPGNENFPKFASELGELMMQEVEIIFDPVKLPDTLEIDAATLIMLDKFILVV